MRKNFHLRLQRAYECVISLWCTLNLSSRAHIQTAQTMGTKRRDKKQQKQQQKQKQQQQHWNKSLANAVGTYEHISKYVCLHWQQHVQHFNTRTNFCFYFPINTFHCSFAPIALWSVNLLVWRLCVLWLGIMPPTPKEMFRFTNSTGVSHTLSLSPFLQRDFSLCFQNAVTVIIIYTVIFDFFVKVFFNRLPPPFYGQLENCIAKNKFDF